MRRLNPALTGPFGSLLMDLFVRPHIYEGGEVRNAVPAENRTAGKTLRADTHMPNCMACAPRSRISWREARSELKCDRRVFPSRKTHGDFEQGEKQCEK